MVIYFIKIIMPKFCICEKSQASFNLRGLTPLYCSKCKTEEMIDVTKEKNVIAVKQDHDLII